MFFLRQLRKLEWKKEDPHTVLSGSYWECADILNQYLVWQCQCSRPKTTWWHCQDCIKTHGLWTAVTGVHLHHTYPAQSKMHHRRWTASCSLPSPMSVIWQVLQDYQNENFSLRKQFLPQSSPDCVTSALNQHTVIFWPTQCKPDNTDHSVCCCFAVCASKTFALVTWPVLLFVYFYLVLCYYF